MDGVGRYALCWFGLVVLAIVNGFIRERGYGRFMPELAAHQVSTLTGICLFGCYTWILTRTWPIGSSAQALAIGVLWLLLAVAFEFIFGHYVMGHPWKRLFHDYNLFRGRLWVLILIWTGVAPYVFFRLQP